MSRPKATPEPIKDYYSIDRVAGGYCITKVSIQDDIVVNTERVAEPDVYVITSAKLVLLLRKILN